MKCTIFLPVADAIEPGTYLFHALDEETAEAEAISDDELEAEIEE